MMKNKAKVIIVVALFTLANMATYAQKGTGKECQAQKTHCEHVIPDLTDDQQAAIESLRVAHKSKMTNYKADLDIKKAELKKLEIATTPNQKAINAKIDEFYGIKTEMAKEKSAHRQEVRALLTDEQKVFFDARRKGGKKGKHGRGHGQGNGRG